MRLLISVLYVIFSSVSNAQLDEDTCFCKNPVDCEVGFVKCSYQVSFENFSHAAKLEGKFVSGDDPSPKASAGVRLDVDELKKINVDFFATTCNSKNFDIFLSARAWTFLKPGDFEHIKMLVDPISEKWTSIPFNGAVISKKLKSTNGLLSLEIGCSGKSIISPAVSD